MLHELHIESLGVIESLDLVLGPGLTVLTGETGAGKTMLVEAVTLLIGGRADPSVVRTGATEARVEGRFVVDDEEFVVARVVPRDGRSRAYVNGRLATAASLAALGSRFVDLHGQHDHQRLTVAGEQRDALDRFCATDLAPLRAARARLTEIDAELAAMGGDARSRAREIDLLAFQADELDTARLEDPNEEVSLARAHDTLAGAVAYREIGAAATAELTDDGGVLDALGAVVHRLAGAPPFDNTEQRLRDVLAEVADVASDLRRRVEVIEDDPERLESLRLRAHQLRDLRRKYGDTLAEVMAFRDQVGRRLDELTGYEGRVAALEAERRRAEVAERVAAAAVAATRRAGAGALGGAVEAHLRELAMPRAQVHVEVSGDDPGDDVTFLLAANPGSPALPLARVASGGELARTMLAVHQVLSDAPPTLVFDEVDAGIGGSAAIAVGRRLAALAGGHQVLVVTHLAQVAAMADAHVVVTKAAAGDSTVATATAVDGDGRVAEVARMLSGDMAGEAARRHAAELLGVGRGPVGG